MSKAEFVQLPDLTAGDHIERAESARPKEFAVLIDGDNISSSRVAHLFRAVARQGVATRRRVYGDWSKPHFAGWKSVMLEYALQPVQQFSYTTGKNATDIAMTIDGMDLLYSGCFDGFWLVSSDSDLTPLAQRIRGAGKEVYGFGNRNTPKAFIAACNGFIFTEVPSGSRHAPPVPLAVTSVQMSNDPLAAQLRRLITELSAARGWAKLSDVGHGIRKRLPDFAKRHGNKKLSELLRNLGFEVNSKNTEVRNGRN